MADAKADIGLIGLAVMGQNLILNMNDKGFTVAAFNRTVSKVDEFLANEAKGTKIIGTHSIQELMGCLKPRRVVLLVKAGQAVDDFIEKILPHTEEGDIIIDGGEHNLYLRMPSASCDPSCSPLPACALQACAELPLRLFTSAGNSNFGDSIRRTKYLEEKKRLFIGTGVSGGEEGARHGPSIMPGGSAAAWPHVKEILQSISAKAVRRRAVLPVGGGDRSRSLCQDGPQWHRIWRHAAHLRSLPPDEGRLGMSCDEMGDVFAEWNKGELDSYLIEITAHILKFKDDGRHAARREDPRHRRPEGHRQVDRHRGARAGHAGHPHRRGGVRALPLGAQGRSASAPAPSSATATAAASASWSRRRQAAPSSRPSGRRSRLEDRLLRPGLHADAEAAKDVRLAAQLRRDRADVARRLHHPLGLPRQDQGGLRRRGRAEQPAARPLLSSHAINSATGGWRKVVSQAAKLGMPTPAFSTALAFYDGYRCKRLPANLLQAQRDYFGAHTFERLDAPGTWEHANWTGNTGRVTASTYLA